MTLQISHLVPMSIMTQKFTFMALFSRNPRRISLQSIVLSPPAELFVARTIVPVLSREEGLSLRKCLTLSREEG